MIATRLWRNSLVDFLVSLAKNLTDQLDTAEINIIYGLDEETKPASLYLGRLN